MAKPRIEDDIKFLWGEVKKGFGFLFGYYKEKYDDYWVDRKIDSWKEGPFPKIKRGVVYGLVVCALFLFTLWRNIPSLIFLGFLAIIFYELVFQKKWVTPIIQETIIILYNWIKQAIIWLYNTIVTQGKLLLRWLWDTGYSLISWFILFIWSTTQDIIKGLYTFGKEIVIDVFDMIIDFIKVIATDVFHLAKEIIMGIVDLISELIQGIFSLFSFGKKEEKES